MALRTDADGAVRSWRRPQAPHSVRTANATAPRRVRAKASAARTPGCQPGACPPAASTADVASAASIARAVLPACAARQAVQDHVHLYVMTDSTLSAPATFEAHA